MWISHGVIAHAHHVSDDTPSDLLRITLSFLPNNKPKVDARICGAFGPRSVFRRIDSNSTRRIVLLPSTPLPFVSSIVLQPARHLLSLLPPKRGDFLSVEISLIPVSSLALSLTQTLPPFCFILSLAPCDTPPVSQDPFSHHVANFDGSPWR